MLYLSDTINPLPFLTGHYLPLALVCQQWRAFLKQQDGDYITYRSVKFQSLNMFQLFEPNNLGKFYMYIFLYRMDEIASYASEIILWYQNHPATKEHLEYFVSMIISCYIEQNNVDAVVYLLETSGFQGMIDQTKIVEFLVLHNLQHLIKKHSLRVPNSLSRLLNSGMVNGMYFEYAKFATPNMQNFICAANLGNVEILRHIMQLGRFLLIRGNLIICDQNIEAVHMLHDAGYLHNSEVWMDSARSGSTSTIRWYMKFIHVKKKALCRQILTIFIELGNLEMVTWMVGHCRILKGSISYSGNNVAIFDYLYQNGHLWQTDDIYFAIEDGNFILCDWLLAHGDTIGQWNHVENFKFVKRYFPESSKISSEMMTSAIRSGNLAYVKWVIKRGHILTDSDLMEAVKRDYLHILIWLDKKFDIRMRALVIIINARAQDYFPTSERIFRVSKWASEIVSYGLYFFRIFSR